MQQHLLFFCGGRVGNSGSATAFLTHYNITCTRDTTTDMSHFTYACKTEGENGISCLISALCVNCLSSISEYSRLNHLDVYLI